MIVFAPTLRFEMDKFAVDDGSLKSAVQVLPPPGVMALSESLKRLLNTCAQVSSKVRRPIFAPPKKLFVS